jgi:hypothetical protein
MANDTDKLTGTVTTKPVKEEDGCITFCLERAPEPKRVTCQSLKECEIERCPNVSERIELEGRYSAGLFTQIDGVTVPGATPRFGFVKLRVLKAAAVG